MGQRNLILPEGFEYTEAGHVVTEIGLHKLQLAAKAGVARQIESYARKSKPAYGADHSLNWQIAIEGVIGEWIISRMLGIEWHGKGVLGGPDVGEDLEVRTSAYNNGRLILHPFDGKRGDDPNRIFWLVTGSQQTYFVRGWIRAADGQRQEFWTNPTGKKGRDAFFVPQSELNLPGTFEREKANAI